MDSTYKRIADPELFEAFRSLLRSCNLPADDLDYNKDLLVGYFEQSSLVGTGALEIHGAYALLRSLSVKMDIRGKAVGSGITELLLQEARHRNLKAVYLLTETAREFFQKKGFASVDREKVPREIRASSEFSHVCPSTAVVMCLPLDQ